jgi:hypothetical protein
MIKYYHKCKICKNEWVNLGVPYLNCYKCGEKTRILFENDVWHETL